MPAWKSKRVQEKQSKKASKRKWKKTQSPSPRNSRTRKKHVSINRRKISRKGNSKEFRKYLKSKQTKNAWKPKTRKKSPSPKRKKTAKKGKRWATDWDYNAMLEVSPGELERYKERNKKSVSPIGLPNWPPKAPSPSELPSPKFKPSVSPTPSINLTEDDYKVLSSAVKDVFKSKTPSPTPKLLRPMDIKSVRTKRDTNLLTPAQIMLLAPSDIASGPKKTKKRKTQKKRKKKRKRKKQKGGKIPSSPPPGMIRRTRKTLPTGLSHKKNRTRKIHNLASRQRSKSVPKMGKSNNKIQIRRTKSEPTTGKNKRLVDLRVKAKIAAALKDSRNNGFSNNARNLLQGIQSTEKPEEVGLNEDDIKLK